MFPPSFFIPIHATIPGPNEPLFPERLRARLLNADVVLGWDLKADAVEVFFGIDRIAKVAAGSTTEELDFLGFAYDGDTDELEWLLAMLLHVKGRHDYIKSDGGPIGPERLTVEDE